MGRKAGKGPHGVTDAVKAVGGPVQAAALMGVSMTTLYAWRRKEAIALAGPCLKLAARSGVPAWRLAGLEHDPDERH
jgi:hypothetical protein